MLALADAHHYHANRLAEGLLSGNTRTVGLIIENVAWPFYSRLCNGVMNAAFRNQTHIITLSLQGDKHEWRPLPLLISQLIEQRVDGIILAAGKAVVPLKSVLELWSHHIVPVVICDTSSEKAVDCIDTDERRLAQVAVEYLLHLGHQRIAYSGFGLLRRRAREILHVLQTRGLSTESFILTPSSYPPTARCTQTTDGEAWNELTC